MNKNTEENILLNHIIKGIENTKGFNTQILDLKHLENAICNYFIICSGNTNTQVQAIADNIVKETTENGQSKPWHIEGYEGKEWILLDFVDIVVHIFQPQIREFYKLEEMWADAKITTLENA